jgi:DNA-binding NtrC family response regulator
LGQNTNLNAGDDARPLSVKEKAPAVADVARSDEALRRALLRSLSPELRKDIAIVRAVAAGRDPCTKDQATEHRPEFNPRTVRALCAVLDAVLEGQVEPAAASAEGTAALTIDSASGLDEALGNVEKPAILKALAATHWNRTAAAKNLGMTLRQLRYRMEAFGID